MSITVDLPIRSIALDEYSRGECANNRKRPRLSIGAATRPAEASAICFSDSRRVMGVVFTGFQDVSRFTEQVSSTGESDDDITSIDRFRERAASFLSPLQCDVRLLLLQRIDVSRNFNRDAVVAIEN